MNLGDVTMVKGCMICHEEVIILAREDVPDRELPEKGSIMPQVCEKCDEKYLSEGILLINPDNGSLAVIKEEAFLRIFDMTLPPQRIAYTDQQVIDLLMEGEANA